MMHASEYTILAVAGAAAVAVSCIGGCARGEEKAGDGGPAAVLNVTVTFAGPVDDQAYYFIALDRDGDFGDDYPVPIANGPYWANGWGTGSITHFLEYHLGAYEVYDARLTTVLREGGGVVTQVQGTPDGGDAGQATTTIGRLAYGTVDLTGAGMIQDATNASGQNAGLIQLQTDAAGNVVAGSVTFTPATQGGRQPTAEQQAQLDQLNAGGVPLATDSLSTFGLTLTLGPPAAASQTLDISPTTAPVTTEFVPAFAGASAVRQGTITAYSTTDTDNEIIPGARITTQQLTQAAEFVVDIQVSQQADLIGPPYAFTVPSGGNVLSAQIDLADLGNNITDISLNIISTTDLIFDTNIVDPDRNCYDGLGPLGNDAITFSAQEFRTYTNAGAFVTEEAGDETLIGPVTEQQQASVDIVDWRVSVQRLR